MSCSLGSRVLGLAAQAVAGLGCLLPLQSPGFVLIPPPPPPRLRLRGAEYLRRRMLPSDSSSGAADGEEIVKYGRVHNKLHRSDNLESLGLELLDQRIFGIWVKDDGVGSEEHAAGHHAAARRDVADPQLDELVLHDLQLGHGLRGRRRGRRGRGDSENLEWQMF